MTGINAKMPMAVADGTPGDMPPGPSCIPGLERRNGAGRPAAEERRSRMASAAPENGDAS